jgi:hypothetical protein
MRAVENFDGDSKMDCTTAARYASRLLAVAVALATITLHYAPDAQAAEGVYDVGVAAVDVTPHYSIRLNGFGFRRDESEGVTQPIFAKALAIGSDADRPIVLITLDSLGIRLPMVEEVARRLNEKAGIERERLIVTFTHSHTTPKVNGASDTIFSAPIPPEHQANIDRYTNELTDSLEKAALEALADRKPARLAWGQGEVRFAKNRRPQGGPVDHALPMLVVRSAEDDKVRAIYVTYACHCVTLSLNKISGDWAGYAAAAIERNHPGAVAMVSIGCGSDANPASGVVGDNIGAASEQGAEIADVVERLLKGTLRPISGKIAATYETIDLPLNEPPTREELAAAVARNDDMSYSAAYQLARLERGEPLQSKIEYPIQTVTFGDTLAMVFMGGEVCVDYKVRAVKEFDADRLWVHGYSNDFCAYIPSERLLKEGGYGGGGEIRYFGLPATLAPGLENKIMAEIHRQVPADFARKQDAAQNDAAAAVKKLVEGLAVGTPAEYERIPDIWRAAIDAGKRNDADELRRLLEVSLPQAGEPATDWQVVVYGGGIINGLSQVDVWPRARIAELVRGDEQLSERCDRMLELCSEMAEDESVRSGTRYDALRVLGVGEYGRYGKQLEKYLPHADGELQMGAVSGLSDMESEAAAEALLAAFARYNDGNRKLAVDAMLRTPSRRAMLKQAIDAGKVPAQSLTAEQNQKLQASGSAK